MQLTKSTKAIIILTAVIVLAAAAYAAFSGSTEKVTNTFTIVYGENGAQGDEVGIIDESDQDNPDRENIWEVDDYGDYVTDYNSNDIPDDAEDLQPGETVYKSPSLTLYTDYDAWIFLEITVPTIEADLDVNNSGSIDSGEKDLICDIVTLDEIDLENWVLIVDNKSDTYGEDSLYVYAYLEPLSFMDSTSDLFKSITVQDFYKVELSETTEEKYLNIVGRVIQTVGNDNFKAAAESLGYEITEDLSEYIDEDSTEAS